MVTMKDILAIWALLVLSPYVDSWEVTVKPNDAVAVNGSDVTLTCTVEGSGDADVLEWNEYITRPEGNRIWWSFDPSTIHRPETFEILGTYNLKIKNVAVQDGGRYGCKLLSISELYPAEVSVYEKSVCNAMGEDLTEFDMAYISCYVPYGGSDAPEVQFYDIVNGNQLNVNTERGDNYVYISANVTAMAETDGRLYQCRVKQENPLYEDTCVTSLNVSYSVRNVTFTPLSADYYSGEEILCTAVGNPEPDVWWENVGVVQVNGSSNQTTNGSVLMISQEMEGLNMWRCVAENTVSGNITTIESHLSFTVYPGERTTPVISLACSHQVFHSLICFGCLVSWFCVGFVSNTLLK